MFSTSEFHFKLVFHFLGIAALFFSLSCEEPSTEEQPVSKITLQVVSGSVTHTSVDLSWTQPQISNFVEYIIYVGTVPNFPSTTLFEYEQIDDIEETTTFVDGLRPKTRYYFRVRVNTADNRAFESNEVSATTDTAPAQAQIRFFHAASTLPSKLTIRVDSLIVDTLSFGAASPYQIYTAGQHFVKLSAMIALDSGTVTFDTTEKATVFILDKPRASSRRFSVVFERDMYDPIVDPFHQTKLRLFNASLGLDTARLYFGSVRPQSIYLNALFGKVEPARTYLTFVPDTLTMILTRYPSGTILGDTANYEFLPDRRYSIVLHDVVDSVKVGVYIDD